MSSYGTGWGFLGALDHSYCISNILASSDHFLGFQIGGHIIVDGIAFILRFGPFLVHSDYFSGLFW